MPATTDIAEPLTLKIGRRTYPITDYAEASRMVEAAPAVIYVDGAEFIRCQAGDDFHGLFDETVRRVGGEVALTVWKPRHGIYLRERLSITASVEG